MTTIDEKSDEEKITKHAENPKGVIVPNGNSAPTGTYLNKMKMCFLSNSFPTD